MKFSKALVTAIENKTQTLLREHGLNAKLNNLENKTAVDMIVNSKRVDIQYSQNFEKYGDIRIDLISAYKSKLDRFSLRNKLKKEKNIWKSPDIEILKKGKFFQNDYLDSVVMWIYNKEVSLKSTNTCNLFIVINKEKLITLLKNNPDLAYNNINLNDKIKNGDNFGSAFISLKLALLEEKGVATKFNFHNIDTKKLQKIILEES
jgi:hypothetical protein